MKKEIRLIAFNNDAIGLAVSNFYFPIIRWQTSSERTKSITSLSQKLAWIIKALHLSKIVGSNPNKKNPHYLTLSERLQSLPKGFSPKIGKAVCLFQPEGTTELYILLWKKDTIHKSQSYESSYQQWITKKIKEVWRGLAVYYKKIEDSFELKEFRPSILVLESARSTSNPKTELANDEDFLFRILLPTLRISKNEMSLKMYSDAYREQRKRGVWEYRPREEA